MAAASNDIQSTKVIDICQETAEDTTQPSSCVSQSSDPSLVQGEPAMSCQMLSVKPDKLPLLQSLQQKVEKNYCVKIRPDFARRGKSAPQMQWISILGSKGDCKDAGAYIGALCNPVEWTVYDFAPMLSDVFNEETCQMIEDKSHAVLIRDGDRRLIIQGCDQLHVILALSYVEDIVARYETNICDSSRRRSSAKHDLDKVLKRAYSNDGEAGDEDLSDWSTMPEEVKRAVLISLLDNDMSEPTVVDVENIADEQAVSQETVPVEILTASVSSFTSSSNSNAAATATVTSTSSITTASTVIDLPPKPDIFDPAVQPLVKLAMSKGYSREEIENVLSKTSRWKESDFLRTLHTNRRIQSAACQQPPVYISKTFQQPTISYDSIVVAQSIDVARDAHIYTLGQSPVFSVTGLNDVPLHRVGTASVEVEDVRQCDTYMDVGEVAAASDSVILLKSDQEMDSSNDGDDDDFEDLEIGKEDSISRLAVSADQCVLPGNIALPDEQAQHFPVQSGATPRKKKNKKKRSKRKVSPNTSVQQEDVAPAVIKTGKDINDLDSISLIPSTLEAVIDVSSDVLVVDDNSDVEVVPENDMSLKPVVSRKARRQMARQTEAKNQSPVMQPSSTSGDTYKNESNNNPRQMVFPTPTANFIPSVTADRVSLRYIVIDGSNVAMSHGNGKVFSCRGVKLVIDFFKQRGHSKVVALVPQWRRQAPTPDHPISDHHLLEILKEQETLSFTPSRRIGNRNISCYDDRFMLDLAIQTEGVIVTNDNYRDLYAEKFHYRFVIENRLLPYSFVDDIFMIPQDPLGQYGPQLDEFLRMPSSSRSALPRDSFSAQNLYSQTGSSSSFDIHPRPFGPRGVSRRENESVVSGTFRAQRFPPPQPFLLNQPYQQPQVRQQRFPPWLQTPQLTQHQQLQPLPLRTSTAIHNFYQSDNTVGAKTGSTSVVMTSGRGRSGQHVAARPPAPTIGPRSVEKTSEMRNQLLDVFPDNAKQVDTVLQQYRYIYNVDELCLKVSEIV